MSARNIFLIKPKEDLSKESIYSELKNYMEKTRFGIEFEIQNYQDELLELLRCEKNYFTITNDKTCTECEEIFSIYEAFEYALNFSKREYRKKEREFLYNKLKFLDDVVQIIFKYNSVDFIEVFISDQYSTRLEDYSRVINVSNGKFANALIESFEPYKNERFYGLKTVRFVIQRKGTVKL